MSESKKSWLRFFRPNKATSVQTDIATTTDTPTLDTIDAPADTPSTSDYNDLNDLFINPVFSELERLSKKAPELNENEHNSPVTHENHPDALIPCSLDIAQEKIAIDAPDAPNDNVLNEKIESNTAIAVSPSNAQTGLFSKLKQGLTKTRSYLKEGLSELVLGKKQIDEEVLEALENRLLMADIGVGATSKIITHLTEQSQRHHLNNIDELFTQLKIEMTSLLKPIECPLHIQTQHKPFIILMVGVNGVGKTTTIGKIAKQLQAQGKSVMLAAGDTFRAAAVDQLKIWGERNDIPVVAQKEGADPASVIFDALESASAKKIDVLIADTAGRLHTQAHLMRELEKVHRVIKKFDDSAPHECMLVIDALTGQNGLNQALQFNQTIPLTSLTITKLDGTAKGGILLAIAEKLRLPVRFIGVGEGIDDLRPFESEAFVDALLGTESSLNT